MKVNKYDGNWEKQWYGAGIFVEASEEVEVDVFKKLDEKGRGEELGLTVSSIEKLGFFSKAEELGLLSLLEKVAGFLPSTLASLLLPLFVAAMAVIVVIPDD
ncbi:uncharacterized protein LOC122084843 [Macadamia integrifolia]|uniref:uncharacterized protein LOC122084843 n=1 Tax=Macadamia integrifolia TaxID=60698 RepID=UPI001C4FCC38|nr:uncharacterized protein LOC122084843 [Macadamia integrifolia]